MPVMLSRTYDAFVAAGAPDDKARAAAEELAAYESRFGEIKQELSQIRGELTPLKWMVGLVIAANVTLLIKAFT